MAFARVEILVSKSQFVGALEQFANGEEFRGSDWTIADAHLLEQLARQIRDYYMRRRPAAVLSKDAGEEEANVYGDER